MTRREEVVSSPFHSRAVHPAQEKFREPISSWQWVQTKCSGCVFPMAVTTWPGGGGCPIRTQPCPRRAYPASRAPRPPPHPSSSPAPRSAFCRPHRPPWRPWQPPVCSGQTAGSQHAVQLASGLWGPPEGNPCLPLGHELQRQGKRNGSGLHLGLGGGTCWGVSPSWTDRLRWKCSPSRGPWKPSGGNSLYNAPGVPGAHGAGPRTHHKQACSPSLGTDPSPSCPSGRSACRSEASQPRPAQLAIRSLFQALDLRGGKREEELLIFLEEKRNKRTFH